ncbi:L-lactate dehydrogenase [Micrococcus sp.]|uniref:L-lactate dehydrogenase n=1 Tax=Micrococcus sp. TaxID=1271 RepID=UPI002A90DF60|nr:L-lactate dehydrogenase [Micrococcus sp.]MDY6055007.1 L-lactate dehydrogenase [Micrococcus sp.]
MTTEQSSAPTTTRRHKVGVVGAGAVGSAVCYATMLRGVADEVALYDIATAKVNAEVADISHGAPFAPTSVITGGDDPAVLADSEVVVITAGAAQKPGQTRLELAGSNVRILSALLPQIQAVAPDALLVLVTNPVDVLTYVAQRITGLPAHRVIGSGTLLDTARLQYAIATAAGVHPSSVNAQILGEHGDSEFAAWSSGLIGPTPVREWPSAENPMFTEDALKKIEHGVMNAAYEVINGKGATNYGIGVSAARLIEAILKDQQVVLPVSTVQSGVLGLNDVALSLPSIVGANGVTQVLTPRLDEAEIARLHASAEALRATAASLNL